MRKNFLQVQALLVTLFLDADSFLDSSSDSSSESSDGSNSNSSDSSNRRRASDRRPSNQTQIPPQDFQDIPGPR